MDFVKKTGKLLKEKKAQFALNLCEQGIAEGGPVSDLLNNEGVAYLYLEDYEKSLDAFERALKADPDNADASYNRSMPLRSMQRHEEALANYEITYQQFPDHLYNLMNRGNVCRRSGDYDAAANSYQAALAIDPENYELLYNLASVRILQGKYTLAEKDLDSALVLNPTDGECWYCKAICRKHAGDAEGQTNAFANALKYKPEERPGHVWGDHPELLQEPHGPAMRSEVIKGI